MEEGAMLSNLWGRREEDGEEDGERREEKERRQREGRQERSGGGPATEVTIEMVEEPLLSQIRTTQKSQSTKTGGENGKEKKKKEVEGGGKKQEIQNSTSKYDNVTKLKTEKEEVINKKRRERGREGRRGERARKKKWSCRLSRQPPTPRWIALDQSPLPLPLYSLLLYTLNTRG